MEKRVLCVLTLFGCLMISNCAFANNYSEGENPYYARNSRYDHIYANPPRQSLGAMGRYIMSSATVRYVHSPSKLKGARHAAKINANNAYLYGY